MNTLNRKMPKKETQKSFSRLNEIQLVKSLRNDQMRHINGASDMSAQASEYFKKK